MFAIESSRGISHKCDVVAKISCHPSCGFTAVVGSQSADDEVGMAVVTEPLVQIRLTIKSRVHAFGDQEIVGAIDSLLERVAGMSGGEGRAVLQRIVAD